MPPKAELDALSGMTSDLSPSPPFLRHHRHNDPINVRVKEIYDMVPLESGEEDIRSGDSNGDEGGGEIPANGKVVNRVESRKSDKFRHADDEL